MWYHIYIYIIQMHIIRARYKHIHVCKNVIGHLLSNLFGLDVPFTWFFRGPNIRLAKVLTSAIWRCMGSTWTRVLLRVLNWSRWVFSTGWCFKMLLPFSRPWFDWAHQMFLEYLMVPNSCMIPCIFSRAGPGINFATSRCCLTLKQRETNQIW